MSDLFVILAGMAGLTTFAFGLGLWSSLQEHAREERGDEDKLMVNPTAMIGASVHSRRGHNDVRTLMWCVLGSACLACLFLYLSVVAI